MINPDNHLPDAVETEAVLYDHWYQWGDVRRRIYFDNFQLFHGIVYPPTKSKSATEFSGNPDKC